MAFVPPARHLLRAKDIADARYFDPLGVDDLARAAGLSRAHFSREFSRTFGEPPHAYLLTTQNCPAPYEELKGRGVEFVEQPEECPYGIDAAFRDPSGNHIRLTEVREVSGG